VGKLTEPTFKINKLILNKILGYLTILTLPSHHPPAKPIPFDPPSSICGWSSMMSSSELKVSLKSIDYTLGFWVLGDLPNNACIVSFKHDETSWYQNLLFMQRLSHASADHQTYTIR
jgi:hypothetical protein